MNLPLPSHSRKIIAALPVIIGANSASAEIIYWQESSGASRNFSIDFNFVDKTIGGSWTPGSVNLMWKGGLMVSAYGGGIASSEGQVSLLSFGDLIDDQLTFDYAYTSSWPSSSEPGYAGFQFTVDDSTYYGWALFGVDPDAENVFDANLTLYGFAYDNTGAAITAGAISAVPEPTTTTAIAGLLAGSAAAFAVRRRRKAQLAAV
ncbi:MAG: PEP-CTERM sorting domain-containing protein [Opitutus sp.]|nr:PEP-CTERM sorting domain-containing protein [Opitutus sp.]